MRLRFSKMQGTGNDYVHVDGIAQDLSVERAAALARTLSDRHYGIGGDGLILLAPSTIADVRMVMWNADGSRGAMCGNGLRCLAKLAHDAGHVRGLELTVECDFGVLDVRLLADEAGVVHGACVPMPAASVDRCESHATIDGRLWRYHRGDAGNPHAVVFVDADPDQVPVESVGLAFQSLAAFPDGVNVEFVRVEPPHGMRQRTFERGSGETLSCGSGATVAALAAIVTGRLPGPEVEVRLRGGALTVRRRHDVVEMEGPAVAVFHGEIDV